MPFFDFHCHPGLKPQFSNTATAPSPWDNINATIEILILKNLGINLLFNEILNSQSSLTQLSKEVKLIGLVLHSPEPNMAKSLGERKIIQGSKISLINYDRIQYIAEGTHNFTLIQQELSRLQQSKSHNGASLAIINKPADFDEQKPDTVFGFLTIEGLHCFFGNPGAADAKEQFTQNFETFTDQHTVLAVNICHLQQNPFCNHAHGIQFFKNEYFYPTGNGFTTWGRAITERLKAKNILVDIKHMSLQSRWQFYSMMKDSNNDDKYVQPFVCTHAGVTGLSIRDRVKYLFKKPVKAGDVYQVAYLKPRSRHLTNTYFNCCSINLYDEDIVAILRSEGLIGLSFDQRILGFANENVLRDVTVPNDVEFISTQESAFFLGPVPEILPLHTSDEDIWTTQDFENLEPVLNTLLHLEFFFNNAFHILQVAKENGIAVKQAAKQICLGTDFDGLINAIDNCKNATELPAFKQQAIAKLPQLLKEARLDNEGLQVQEFIEDLFYRNGRDFVIRRLGV